jgi:CubicO group peptidase (beta-lactamase class C family)
LPGFDLEPRVEPGSTSGLLKSLLAVVSVVVLVSVGLATWALLQGERVSSDADNLGETRTYDPSFVVPAVASDGILRSARANLGVPALSASVGVDGTIVWSRAVGYADIKGGHAVSLASRFRIGSVSQAVTSLALGRLVEEGYLDLDAPIRSFVTDFPDKGRPITARQLAGHRSGIRHYGWRFGLPPHERLSRAHYDSVRESLKVFADDPLVFEPGTGSLYSCFGYVLLSAALEEASGKEFPTLLREEVFEPLGMWHTSPDSSTRPVEDRVSFYRVKLGRASKAVEIDSSARWAADWLLSTPEDLVKMGNALIADRFLARETRELLFAPQAPTGAEVASPGFGLGWRVDSADRPGSGGATTRLIYQGGASVGGGAFLLLYPEDRLVVAIAANGRVATRRLRGYVDGLAEQFLRSTGG